MDFSSISAYLDPSNWQQQPNPQPGASSGNPQLPPPLPPPPPPQPHVGGGAGSIRPSSMAHRAQMANIPMPEAALRCPRCDSPNTKFCYFNNYSLTQPRHFCKTCRRYWTRGGALRNVPVGGGCRRNKKSKAGSSSKSPAPGSDRQTSSGSSGAVSSNSAGTASILAGLTPQIPPPLHFMSPLSQLSKYGAGDIGLNYGGIGISSAPLVATNDMNFQLGSGSLGGGGSGGGGYGVEQWLSQPAAQISSVGGLDFPAGLYPFQGGIEPPGYGGEGSQVTQVRPKLSTSGMTQQNSVKMEENKELNLARQFLGIQGNDQYWSGSPWTDLSGCSSSSTRNPL